MQSTLLETSIPNLNCRRGKVRDVYDLGDRLLMISTDRISAFDWILPGGIPDKGRVLTRISAFWFQKLGIPHHVLADDVSPADLPPSVDIEPLRGRSMIVCKAAVVPVECVVRGYLEGSGWKEYRERGTVCGIKLPKGLKQCSKLPEPLFTPATKAETGHDENITFKQMVDAVGKETAETLREQSLLAYRRGTEHAGSVGLLIADTKFEWGWYENKLILIDEALTPDSSRFWPADDYEPGRAQRSVDKQYVREWLEASDWDKNSPPPILPEDVVDRTREKYIEACERITGTPFPWK